MDFNIKMKILVKKLHLYFVKFEVFDSCRCGIFCDISYLTFIMTFFEILLSIFDKLCNSFAVFTNELVINRQRKK